MWIYKWLKLFFFFKSTVAISITLTFIGCKLISRDFQCPLWPMAFSLCLLAKLPWQPELYVWEGEDIIWRGGGRLVTVGFWDRWLHAWPDKFCLPVVKLGWQPSCGDQGQWQSCVCPWTVFAAPHPTLSNHSGKSDTSGNLHWCRAGAPAVRKEQQGGVGWGKMSSRENGAVDGAYQAQQDLAALWFVGESIDKVSIFLSDSVPYCFQW